MNYPMDVLYGNTKCKYLISHFCAVTYSMSEHADMFKRVRYCLDQTAEY